MHPAGDADSSAQQLTPVSMHGDAGTALLLHHSAAANELCHFFYVKNVME